MAEMRYLISDLPCFWGLSEGFATSHFIVIKVNEAGFKFNPVDVSFSRIGMCVCRERGVTIKALLLSENRKSFIQSISEL